MRTSTILLEANLVSIKSGTSKATLDSVATICANLAYYGYVLSEKSFKRLLKLDGVSIRFWWNDLEFSLKKVTGDDRNIEEYVVYKNFPAEALDKSAAEYWFSQICMYLGCPNEYFTEEVVDREPLFEKMELKSLGLAYPDSLSSIAGQLLRSVSRWTDGEKEKINFLVGRGIVDIDASQIPFKENMATIVAENIDNDIDIEVKSATDTLRIAVGMSDGDVTLKEKSRFKNFSRKERRFLLSLLNNATDLQGDMARDKSVWKKFIKNLHPNDYKSRYENVCIACDALYNNKVKSFNSSVELKIESRDISVLDDLSGRPGNFVRRFHHMYEVFGKTAVSKIVDVLPKLTTYQLLKFSKYIETVNDRSHRTIAPKGNWNKLRILENNKVIEEVDKSRLLRKMAVVTCAKMSESFNYPVNLSERTKNVKLKNNDSDLCEYGRGTTFDIPDNVDFIRTASYWESDSHGCIWYDNGWNFFDEDWEALGSCCWTNESFSDKASVFSGDPTSAKTDGKACQLIDLYINKLNSQGVRYAVWSILCYSQQSFDESVVFAAMQWGEGAQEGGLFEPSRCKLSFYLNGANTTKYIAYVDIKERKLVYMDANLPGAVSSANHNSQYLAKTMPAFVEYLDAIPSVHDLFSHCDQSADGVVIDYDDADHELTNGVPAYIFKPVNEKNNFDQIDLSKILG